MNRIWIFLCFLCIPWAARGQSAYEWRYWFDTDEDQQQTGQGSGEAFSISADAAALSEGMHTIHMQIADTAGHYSPPQTRLFYRVKDRTVKRLRYWFDGVADRVASVLISGTAATVDVAQLEPGVHFFYCQAEDAAGNVSDVSTGIFYRPLDNSVATWSYWFDEDRQARQTASCPDGPVMVDVSDLADGFHTIYQQVSERTPSAVVSRWFIKIPPTEGTADMTCICTVNEKMVGQQRVPARGGIISWNLDVNVLPVGLHRAVFQVVTATGAASTIAERFFVRAITPAEVGNMQCVYTLDNSDTQSQAGMMANGLFHFDLDVASLEEGLHRIAYMMVAEDGSTTPQQTAFFWKTPVGGNGIVQYDYWLNDEEQAMKSIRLDKRENPFKLISLLPVDAQPIRSSCFHFEMNAGQPTVYAKNDFHIRFYDTAGRCLNDSREFIDYQVGRKVTDMEALEPGITATADRPEGNAIKWYQLTAERGDSLSLKTDVACTIQLFAPSGAEVYNASGPDVVKWGGLHASETGTFYLALHDVTAQQGTTVSIDYQHIGKLEVLSYTPKELGVLPITQLVDISGNGYDLIKTVVLRNDSRTIECDSVLVRSKSEAQLVLTFTGEEPLGNYDLVMTFEDEEGLHTLTRTGAFTLAEPDFGDIAVEITDPRRIGSPYPVSIKVTNNSNITYLQVPFYMAYDNIDEAELVSFENFTVEMDEQLADSGMVFVQTIVNFNGTKKPAKLIPTLIPAIKPHETQTFVLGFNARNHAHYNVMGYCGTPYNLYAQETMDFAKDMAKKRGNDVVLPGGNGNSPSTPGTGGNVVTSCLPDPCEYIGLLDNPLLECGCAIAYNLVSVFTNMYLGIADDYNARMRDYVRSAYSGEDVDDILQFYPHYALRHPSDFIRHLVSRCTTGRLQQFVEMFIAMQDMIGEDPCAEFTSHRCDQYNPGDPNDIFGYMAESGSKYLMEGVTDVYYTIEFENDPEIANASAHTIVVTDTLDTSRFDLSTFAAKSVKLGDKVMELDGEKNFSKRTMDLRPEIDVVAQVSLSLDEQKGIAKLTVESLDPMTMEPTTDVMQGVLPVNVNGNGQGELTFDIKLGSGLKHGDMVSNRAGIAFDSEGAIMTPTWTNIVDGVKPVSRVTEVTLATDSTATVSIEATDDGSGPWRYDVYVQYGSGAWFVAAENVPADTMATVKVYEDMVHHFYCIATDMAGNVEQKEPTAEASLSVGTVHLKGDLNGDGQVTAADVWALLGIIARGETPAEAPRADVNGDGHIDIGDVNSVIAVMVR